MNVNTNEMYLKTLVICGKIDGSLLNITGIDTLYKSDLVITELISFYINKKYKNNLSVIFEDLIKIVGYLDNKTNGQLVINDANDTLRIYDRYVRHFDSIVFLHKVYAMLENIGIDGYLENREKSRIIPVKSKRTFKLNDSIIIIENNGFNLSVFHKNKCIEENVDIVVFYKDKIYFNDRKEYELKVIY